jgi:carbon-monoxide dehydrogenase large subunit
MAASPTSPAPPRFVGARLRRSEDPRFLTGRGSYVDDLAMTALVQAAFVRSPYAHARITRIDTAAARRAPGVLLVLTAADLAADVPTLQSRSGEGLKPMAFGPLARDKVRFVGDPVALVVASDRYRAEDACELIEVEYEGLPAVVDLDQARQAAAPTVDDAMGTNVVYQRKQTYGDVDAAFGRADLVVRERFVSNRQTNVPMETRGVVMAYNPGTGQLTAWVGTQAPHLERGWLAQGLGIEENRIRVIAPDIGGAFGQKYGLYRDEWAIAIAAMRLGRPVKWIEDRRENLLASCHAREDVCEVEAAVRRDGTILAMRVNLVGDVGAYPLYPSAPHEIPAMSAYMVPGPYKLEAFSYEVTAVVTNKCPQGSYRAPWAFSTWLHEGMVERIAAAVELDSVEVRRRNLIRREDMPWKMLNETGWEIDAVSLSESLERALTLLDYPRFRQEQQALRAQGRYRGVGLCVYAEPTGFGYDVATVRVEPSGTVTAMIGISGHGQGYETTMAQVVADEMGVDISQVRIVQNDTAAVTFGNGTGGSRGAVVGAGSLTIASRAVKEKALAIAAHLLEARVEDLDWIDGTARVKGVPERALTLAQIADKAYNDVASLPQGMSPLLDSTGSYVAPPTTFSNSAHLCVVEVDPDTGVVSIPRYIVVNDCGVMINPMIVEGQIRGGTAQGIAGALYEELHYDEDGQLLNSTLMDYLVPTPAEIPTIEIDHLVTPSPHSLGGIKGVGEGGTLGAPPAVANAIADALAPFGANPNRMPFTPERVLNLIRSTK